MFGTAVKVAIVAIIFYKVVEPVLRPQDAKLKKHYPGDCRQVKGLDYGSEDFEVTKDGLAFVTSGLWFETSSSELKDFLKSKNIKGNIFLYDFKKPELGARKLTLIPSKEFNSEIFRPHGISLLEDTLRGEHLLYVVNHRESGDDAIEKFKYLPGTNELKHLKSFTGSELHITNDLAVIAEDRFYVTNFHYFKNYFLHILENIFSFIGFGSIVFYNGTGFTVLKPSMNSPNGLFLSKDRRLLYVALPRASSVKVFEINGDYSLTEVQSALIHSLPDNLHLSQSGDALYTGAHTSVSKVLQHLQDPNLLAPSSVVKLPLKDGKIVLDEITELFYDHGELISGSSVGAVYNNKLLIGSILNKLVICDTNIQL